MHAMAAINTAAVHAVGLADTVGSCSAPKVGARSSIRLIDATFAGRNAVTKRGIVCGSLAVCLPGDTLAAPSGTERPAVAPQDACPEAAASGVIGLGVRGGGHGVVGVGGWVSRHARIRLVRPQAAGAFSPRGLTGSDCWLRVPQLRCPLDDQLAAYPYGGSNLKLSLR